MPPLQLRRSPGAAFRVRSALLLRLRQAARDSLAVLMGEPNLPPDILQHSVIEDVVADEVVGARTAPAELILPADQVVPLIPGAAPGGGHIAPAVGTPGDAGKMF